MTIVPTALRFVELGPDAPHHGARLAAVRDARAVLTGRSDLTSPSVEIA